MAKKVDRSAAPKPPAPRRSAAADEMQILHPDREITIAGRALVIREYGFVEGLKLRTIAQPFIDALYALVGGNGNPPDFDQVESLLVDHPEHVLPLIAKAADVEVEWIGTLSDEDGYLLMQEWWLVCSGFFIRRVVQRLATARAVAVLAGQRSTTRSSAPATAAPPATSESSPRAS